MQQLTKEQLKNFDDVNKRLGLTEQQVKASAESLSKAQKKKSTHLTFSSDPLQSDVEPIFINVGSIQQLKEMVGVADGNGDKDIPYPPPLTAHEKEIFKNAKSLADLRSHMSEAFAHKILKAAEAYIMGNSEKVKEYVDLINDIRFPGRLAVFAGDTLNIPANSTYTVSGADPVVWNYQSITVGSGGQIVVETQLTSTSQTLTVN